MSDEGGGGGGDGGGGGGKGGDSGGFGKGSASSPSAASNVGNNSGSTLEFAPPANSGPSVSDFTSNPAGNFDVVNDPSQGNLTGPGPLGGDSGVPGAGGGTNTPFSYGFDNSGFMVDPNTFGGQPVSGGVFDTGAAPLTDTSGQPFQSLINSTAAPSGTSAAGISAPASVAANPDSTSSTDLSSINKTASSNGGGVTPTSSVADTLGIKPNLGSAVAAGGLLNSVINGQQSPPYSAPLNANAASANAVAGQQTSAGQALQQWQTTGTLPDSYESQIQRAANDAKTRAISNAAANGLPTDPTKNTALAQQLNAIDAALPGQREAIAAQLAQSGQGMINAGLQATGISSGVFQTLANLQNSKDQAVGTAIGNFASALNGGNKNITIKAA